MGTRIRALVLLLLLGQIWYLGMLVFFIYSGAQQILANPAHQSGKFLEAFMVTDPLPRMADDAWLVNKGLFLVGLTVGCALIFLNGKWTAPWPQKGVQFGLLLWAVAIPWFEFYLPYNVMHEPFRLVLFEAALWLGVLLFTGLGASFILNFKRPSS